MTQIHEHRGQSMTYSLKKKSKNYGEWCMINMAQIPRNFSPKLFKNLIIDDFLANY